MKSVRLRCLLLPKVLTTWTTIGSVMLLQMSSQDLNHVGASGASYGFIDKCSNDIISGIWSDLPKCQPRQEVVKLPLPDDPDVVEVIPSHVVVPRCSGVCHQGNLYHQCVPHDKERGTKTFKVKVSIEKQSSRGIESRFILDQVMFRRLNSIVECSSVTLETHNSCKCGCDLESANCSEKQVQSINHTHPLTRSSFMDSIHSRTMTITFASVGVGIMPSGVFVWRIRSASFGTIEPVSACVEWRSTRSAPPVSSMMPSTPASACSMSTAFIYGAFIRARQTKKASVPLSMHSLDLY